MKRKIYVGFLLIIVTLNILSWNSTVFCDWFRQHVFFYIEQIFARFSNLFPFSLGEYMIYIGIVMMCLLLVSIIVRIFIWKNENRYIKTLKNSISKYIHGFMWIVAIIALIMSFNCTVLFHCTSFSELYIAQNQEQNSYTVKQLVDLRDYVIKRANTLARKVERNENGDVQYNGDLSKQARLEMERMGEKYELLNGYYPNPKKVYASKLLSQQYMMGYYLPFSLEATYNSEMYISNVPSTMCHELAHLQGFLYEEDANFISYLACVESDDIFFQYCGYLSVINYLNNDLLKSLNGDQELYKTYRQCNELVRHDKIFLTEDAWNMVEKNAVVKTSTMKKVSSIFVTASLNMNGVEDGMASYQKVVDCMLQYYSSDSYDS